MSAIDIVILIMAIMNLGLIGYFHFYKNRKKPCHGCPYAKNCESCEKHNNVSKN